MQTSAAPLIGVIANQYPVGPTQRAFCGAFPSYLNSVIAAGGLPIIVPLGLPTEALHGVYLRLDGVLLTGGGDIDPQRYHGEATRDMVRGVTAARDEAELQVTQWAVKDDMPLLGICRGHQVVNVALGGDLVVDIPSQIETAMRHDYYASKPLDHIAHTVSIEPESRLAALVGTTTLRVNSRHHQAVKHLGSHMVPTAYATDGIIEGTEKPDARFLVTVQWHPENLLDKEDGATLALFKGLVEAAQANGHGHR